MARPTTYAQDIADEICSRLASGDSVRKICADDGMPDERTVFRWLASNGAFRQQYAGARESRADARFERVDEIMQDLRDGKIDSNQARVMLDAIKWQTGKEAPKRYGDRLELAGDKDAPLQTKVVIEVIDSPAQIVAAQRQLEGGE